MKFTLTLAFLAASVVSARNLPGLNAVQSGYARSVIAKSHAEGISRHGCAIAIAVALTESSLIVYANNAVPASLKYHHDRLGSDHDKIGIFQQSASIYKDVQCDMDPGCSAGLFFVEMTKIKGWQNMTIGTVAQKVQRSAYPDRYSKLAAAAVSICGSAYEN